MCHHSNNVRNIFRFTSAWLSWTHDIIYKYIIVIFMSVLKIVHAHKHNTYMYIYLVTIHKYSSSLFLAHLFLAMEQSIFSSYTI